MSTPHYVSSMLSIIVNGEANESLTTRLTYIRCKIQIASLQEELILILEAVRTRVKLTTPLTYGKQTLQGQSRKVITE